MDGWIDGGCRTSSLRFMLIRRGSWVWYVLNAVLDALGLFTVQTLIKILLLYVAIDH